MNTKNTFSRGILLTALLLCFLGIAKETAAQTKVANTPNGQAWVTGIDGLYLPCNTTDEFAIDMDADGELVSSAYEHSLINSTRKERIGTFKRKKGALRLAKKARSATYHGDSLFFLLYADGSVDELGISGCPNPGMYLIDTFKTPVPATSSGAALKSIVGDKVYVQGLSWIMSTDDSGKTWQADTTGLVLGKYGWVFTLSIDTNQTVWTYRRNTNTGQSGLFKQASNSNTWVSVPSFTNQFASIVQVDRNNTIWVTTGDDYVYYSSDEGKTWTEHKFTQGYQAKQTCVDAYGYLYALGPNLLYRSADKGANWTRIGQSISNMVHDTTAGNTIFNNIYGDSVLTLATGIGLFHSIDKGTTWVEDTFSASNILGYQEYPNGRKVMSTPLATYLQKTGSKTWTRTYPASEYYPSNIESGDNSWPAPVQKIYTDAMRHLFMQGINKIGNGYDVVRSNDSGSTWVEDTLGMYAAGAASSTSGFYYVDSTGTQHISVNHNPAIVFSKTLTGAWTADTAGMGAAGLEYVFAFVDASGYLYAAGDAAYTSGYNGRVMRRSISGGTWALDTSGLGSEWNFNLARNGKGDLMAYEPAEVSNTSNAKVFYRSAATGKWQAKPSLPSPLSFCNGGAMYLTGTRENGWLLSTNYYFGNGSFAYYQNNGVWCSTDSGTTWNKIGLDSVYINQIETIGDTVFALTDQGLYKDFACSSGLNTGIQHSSNTPSNSIKVYPNPNDGNFVLELNNEITGANNANAILKIMDLTGRKVLSYNIKNSSSNIQADGLAKGFYIWEVYSENKLIGTGKIGIIK